MWLDGSGIASLWFCQAKIFGLSCVLEGVLGHLWEGLKAGGAPWQTLHDFL